MKYIIFALILSICIHLLIFKTYKIKDDVIKDNPSTTKNPKKSNVKYVLLKPSIKKEEPKIKKEVSKKQIIEKKEPIKKLVKKKHTYKKVNKNNIKVAKKRKVKKEIIKKTRPKPIKKTEVVPNYTKLNPTKLQKDALENYLITPVKDLKLLDKLTQDYIKLYGDEYNTFTKVQKVFLQKNLKTINQVLHQYYRFPSIALRLRKSDKNIVEFTLHPNGDITNLKIKENGNYPFYDKSIIETIEIAYKDFPRPKEPTKIIMKITYTVY